MLRCRLVHIAVPSKSCCTPHLVILQKFVEFHQLVLQVKVLKFRQGTNWMWFQRNWKIFTTIIGYLPSFSEWKFKKWLKPPPIDIVRSTLLWLKTIALFWSLIFQKYPPLNQHNPWQFAIPIWDFIFQPLIFRDYVSFREGTPFDNIDDWSFQVLQVLFCTSSFVPILIYVCQIMSTPDIIWIILYIDIYVSRQFKTGV